MRRRRCPITTGTSVRFDTQEFDATRSRQCRRAAPDVLVDFRIAALPQPGEIGWSRIFVTRVRPRQRPIVLLTDAPRARSVV